MELYIIYFEARSSNAAAGYIDVIDVIAASLQDPNVFALLRRCMKMGQAELRSTIPSAAARQSQVSSHTPSPASAAGISASSMALSASSIACVMVPLFRRSSRCCNSSLIDRPLASGVEEDSRKLSDI